MWLELSGGRTREFHFLCVLFPSSPWSWGVWGGGRGLVPRVVGRGEQQRGLESQSRPPKK